MNTVPTRSLWRSHHLSVAQLLLLSITHLSIFIISSHTCLCISTNTEDTDDNILFNDTQYSNWSEWSPCSRSCDGGISVSLRKCLSKADCVGKVERYKICNMQPCPILTDFRAKQCSMFNNKPYRERYYEWLPFIDPTDPCSLTCQAKDLNFVAQLAVSVKDGTRCRPGSLDMCVSGKCLSVGCDLQLGSLTKIDDCGICGGDGSSCRRYHYSWTHRYLTNCSHSCGGGVQLSNVSCLNEDTDTIVDEIFCHANFKPRPVQHSCNNFECSPTWVVGNWTECDRKCSIGKRTRNVFCAISPSHPNDLRRVLLDSECLDPKPDFETKCNIHECPQWYEGLWSECSETCGNGTQTRHVACRDSQGLTSEECEQELKPITQRNCSDISKCLHSTLNSQEDSPQLPVTTQPSFFVGPWSSCNVSCGIGNRTRHVECKIYLEYSKTELSIPESECLEENGGDKPPETEECFGTDCENTQEEVEYITDEKRPKVELSYQVLNETSYSWQESGFTQCSLPCLGGTQETNYECVRWHDNATVDSSLCDSIVKPETYTRTCNDHPCPPRWNVTEFSECSRNCGVGGTKTRIVRCVHAVTRGSTNVVVIPDQQCKTPMPAAEEPCNRIDCPAQWRHGLWSKCSTDCGRGIKILQEVRCVKEFAVGGEREVSDHECSMKKPKGVKVCKSNNCRYDLHKNSSELSRKSKRNHNTAFPLDHITLKVAGKATVYEGSIVKLRCPDWKKFRNQEDDIGARVSWSKGSDRLISGKRFHLIHNLLRIKHIVLNDSAVYKCWTDFDDQHSMFLHVLPRPNGTLTLNDQTSQAEARQKSYYKNELDLSQEAHKNSFRDANVNLPRFEGNIKKTRANAANSYDSWEMSQNRFKSQHLFNNLNDPISFSHPSFNEVGPYLKGEKKKKHIPSLLRESNYKDLTFNWITTEWSKCTIACGGIGFKMRLSQCYVQLDNITEAVESSFCTERNLVQPKSIEKCGFRECSFWKVGKWSECDDCLDHHQGVKHRSVNCMMPNGTVLEEWNCLQMSPKPFESQQCVNLNCIAHWLPKSWTVCNRNGYKSRQVQCVWKATQKPSKSSKQCSRSKKPVSVEKCTESLDAVDL